MAFIRSISGLRATLGDDLTPMVAAAYASAFAHILPEGPIVVGLDGRPSGHWIADVVIGSLRSCGRTVRTLGMVPTPTVQLFTETSNAVGGLIITASHNPEQWNGIKFLDAGGVFLDADANAQLWNCVDNNSFGFSAHQQHGTLEFITDAIDEHLQSVQRISLVESAPMARGETVVVDAVNCSGSTIVPELLRSFGYNVVELYCDGSGIFPHPPEPTTENLTELGIAVRKHRAAFGVAVDPDADRLVLYDEDGEAIGEEKTITLAVQASGELRVQNAERFVVVNYSTTRMVDDVASAFGMKTLRAAVGEINVVRKMQQYDAVIGGEGSGGVIFPACHAGRDSLVAIGLITSMLRRKKITLKQSAAELPRYFMTKSKFELSDRSQVSALLELVSHELSDGEVSKEDGIYVSWSDRWIHVRASNTEPILRVIAEAPTQKETAMLVGRVAGLVQTVIVEQQ